MRVLLCKIGWLKYYQGCDVEGEYSRPLNGGSYNENNIGHEADNFRDYGGNCYGYFTITGNGTIMHLEKYYELEHKANELDGVTIIFVASANGTPKINGTRIVGWYKNATIYREPVYEGEYKDYYRAKAKVDNCFVVPEDERYFIMNHQFRQIMYYEKKRQATFKKAIDYIEGYTKSELFVQDNSTASHIEGITKHILLEYKTRNHTVVQEAKFLHKEKHGGTLPCKVCGFNFSDTYGQLGDGFIEAHHIQHHAKQGVRGVAVEDFELVCPNCHRMLHRDDTLTVDRLRKIIQNV